jgi:hypothetical protein
MTTEQKVEENIELRGLLGQALSYLDYGKPEPYTGHICGPDAGCDMNCMDVAHYGEFRKKARAFALAIREP